MLRFIDGENTSRYSTGRPGRENAPAVAEPPTKPIRPGSVAAVALGARSTLIGRAYLYGLMAGGEAGVERAIAILSSQVSRTMRLLGVTSLDELNPRHVTQLRRLGPRDW